jgi:parallel beta-helix repeat protein
MKRILIFILFCLSFCSYALSEEIKIYVSPAGNDIWKGTVDKPYATLQKARDAIRFLKSEGKITGPVMVYLRGGYYELTDTFILKPEDSGSELYPISYIAYPGEKPVISGGRKIVSQWKPYKDKIIVCSLPEVQSGKLNFRQLFVNGERQIRARTPDTSYYLVDKNAGDLGKSQIRYVEGDNRSWPALNNTEVVLFHMWNESRLFISDINLTDRTINFTGQRGGQPLRTKGVKTQYFLFSNRYYLENELGFLDKPKEWYLDYTTGKLYFWPTALIEKSEVRVPVLRQLVRLEGRINEKKYVQYIVFSGLTFTDTEWSIPKEGYPTCGDVGDMVLPSAIALEGARKFVFKDNIIKNIGSYAIEVTGSGNLIKGNFISDCGGGGIISRSYDKEPNIISYNSINNCGKVFPSSVGINIDDGGGTISHNLIHDLPQSGIYTRHWATSSQKVQRRNQSQPLLIEYNEIYNVMQKLNDGGAVFVRDSNIIIRNNLIHDVMSYPGGAPGWGIYLGCETRNSLVENNLVYRTTEGIHIWYSNRNNLITNNIIIDSQETIVKSNNESNTSHENIRITKNIFYFNGTDVNIFKIDGKNSLPSESDYNIFWNPRGCLLLSPVIRSLPGVDYYEDWKKSGFEAHSIVTDPLFVNDEKDDYTLKRNSPAFKLGFRPIDFSTVGIRVK